MAITTAFHDQYVLPTFIKFFQNNNIFLAGTTKEVYDQKVQQLFEKKSLIDQIEFKRDALSKYDEEGVKVDVASAAAVIQEVEEALKNGTLSATQFFYKEYEHNDEVKACIEREKQILKLKDFFNEFIEAAKWYDLTFDENKKNYIKKSLEILKNLDNHLKSIQPKLTAFVVEPTHTVELSKATSYFIDACFSVVQSLSRDNPEDIYGQSLYAAITAFGYGYWQPAQEKANGKIPINRDSAEYAAIKKDFLLCLQTKTALEQNNNNNNVNKSGQKQSGNASIFTKFSKLFVSSSPESNNQLEEKNNGCKFIDKPDNGQSAQEFIVSVMGDHNTGKSSFLARVVNNKDDNLQVEKYGSLVTQYLMINENLIKLRIVEKVTNSGYCLPSLTGTQGAIFLVDLTDEAAFSKQKNHIAFLIKLASDKVEKILVGTKSDAVGEGQVKTDDIKAFAKENNIIYIETSAKTGKNVHDALAFLGQKMLTFRQQHQLEDKMQQLKRPIYNR